MVKPIDADAFATRRWKPVRKRPDVILIHLVRLVVAAITFFQLIFEPLVLLHRIVQLAEGITEFKPACIDFKPLHPIRIIRLLLRQRRDGGGKLIDDGGLHQVFFGHSLEDARNRLAFWFAGLIVDVSPDCAKPLD